MDFTYLKEATFQGVRTKRNKHLFLCNFTFVIGQKRRVSEANSHHKRLTGIKKSGSLVIGPSWGDII